MTVKSRPRVRIPPAAPRRSKVRFAPTSFYACGKKDVIRPLPCSSFPTATRCAGLAVGGPPCGRPFSRLRNIDFSCPGQQSLGNTWFPRIFLFLLQTSEQRAKCQKSQYHNIMVKNTAHLQSKSCRMASRPCGSCCKRYEKNPWSEGPRHPLTGRCGAHRISRAMTAFWAWRRFSASSKISPAWASNTASVISSSRWAGRQCWTMQSGLATAMRASLTW